MKICYILRGLPGSGKSTFAKSAVFQPLSFAICSADDYFVGKDGVYRFDQNKLGKAHGCCRQKFIASVRGGIQVIVVDNTNTTRKEYADYERIAKEHGYEVIIKKFECSVEDSIKRNTHNVPEATIRKMFQRMEKDK